MDIIRVNDPPVVDVPPITVNYTNGDPIVPLSDPTDPISVSDIDSPFLLQCTVELIAGIDTPDEVLSVITGSTGIIESYNANTGVLTLSGQHTPSAYSAVLATLSYENIAEAHSGTRFVDITCQDNSGDALT